MCVNACVPNAEQGSVTMYVKYVCILITYKEFVCVCMCMLSTYTEHLYVCVRACALGCIYTRGNISRWLYSLYCSLSYHFT